MPLVVGLLMFDLLVLEQTAERPVGLVTAFEMALVDSIDFVLWFSHPRLLFVWKLPKFIGKFLLGFGLSFTIFTSSFSN